MKKLWLLWQIRSVSKSLKIYFNSEGDIRLCLLYEQYMPIEIVHKGVEEIK